MFILIIDTIILHCLLAVVILIERISNMCQLMLAAITKFFSLFVADVASTAFASEAENAIYDVAAAVGSV